MRLVEQYCPYEQLKVGIFKRFGRIFGKLEVHPLRRYNIQFILRMLVGLQNELDVFVDGPEVEAKQTSTHLRWRVALPPPNLLTCSPSSGQVGSPWGGLQMQVENRLHGHIR